MEKGSTYWTFKRVIKVSAGIGIPIIALFTYLALSGALNVTSYSHTEHCAGTSSDLCYLYFNATPTKTIYIQADSQWLETTPPIKTIKLQRTWGTGWRTLDLTKPWSKTVKYALKLNKGQEYQFRFIAEKYDPRDIINWSINPEGEWGEALPIYKFDTEEVIYFDEIEHTKIKSICINKSEQVKCDDKYDISNITGCYLITQECNDYEVIDYIEKVQKIKIEKIENSDYIQYAEDRFNYKKEGFECKNNACDKWCDKLEDGNCIDLPDSNGDGICTSGESDCIELQYTNKIEVKLK